MRGRPLLLALGIAGATALLAPPAGAASLNWSAPVLIDHGPTTANPAYVSSVDCPSPKLCVAFSDKGVTVTTRPDRPGAWSPPRPVFPSGGQPSVSCPSVSMCVAFSESGQIAAAAHVASGAWRLTSLTSFAPGTAISCPSVSLCVGVDGVGDVISSRRPLGGASAWNVARVDPGPHGSIGPTGVSCPSVRLCVVVDFSGNVLTSTNPSGGAGAWTLGRVDTRTDARGQPYGLWGVSCPSTSTCVALDGHGGVASTTDPAAGASDWRVIHAAGTVRVEHLSCVSSSLCVALSLNGVLSSRNPTAKRPRWRHTVLAAYGPWDPTGEISCPSASLCVLGSGGQLASTVKPTGPASTWNVRPFPFSQSIASVSCPSAHLCVAVDDAGDAITSTAPGARRPAWRTFQISGPNAISTVACPTTSLCVASLGNYIATSRNPATGPKAWTASQLNPGSGALVGLSCPSTSLCVAPGGGGNVVVSTDPRGGRGAWHLDAVDDATFDCYAKYFGSETCNATVVAVACATRSFCLGVDNDGNTVTSNDPAGGPSSWTLHAAGLTLPLPGEAGYPGQFSAYVSCPSTRLCVVVDSEGHVETSTNPTGDAAAWTHTDLHDAGGFTGISCRTVSFCVAVDAVGNAFTSSDPTGGATAWKRRNINRSIPLTGIACPTTSLCVAVDGYGYAAVGH